MHCPSRIPPCVIGFLVVAVLSGEICAYDYSRPVKGVPGLPLEYPETPFVLRFTREELQAQPVWAQRLDGVVISLNAGSPVRIGAQTLQEACARLQSGRPVILETDPEAATLPAGLGGGHYIVLGAPENLRWLEYWARSLQVDISEGALNGDGFVIKPCRDGNAELLVIASPVERGALYGAYELEERTTPRGLPRLDCAVAPAVRFRSWPIHAFTDEPFGVSGRWRLNVSMIFDYFWNATLAYPGFPELRGQERAAVVTDAQQRLHAKLADAGQYGAMPAMMWNPFSFCLAPAGGGSAAEADEVRAALEKTYPGISAQPWGPQRSTRCNLCPSHPATRRFVEEGVRELARTFPELQVIVIYYSDQGGEITCGCERCASYPFIDRVTDYATLLMRTAHECNPKLRFLMRSHGLDSLIPTHQPEYQTDPSVGLREVKRRLGDALEAITIRVTSPSGRDFQSWLSPDSSLLGQGVPVYFFFQYHEAGGPGIVAPISPVMSHLSWPLPAYLEKLNKFIQPGQGMVGGTSPVAGMEVAWWHPDLDAVRYMRNWCEAKYGPEAGGLVSQALEGTQKITEGFILNVTFDNTCTFHLYRWGGARERWATDMAGLLAAVLPAVSGDPDTQMPRAARNCMIAHPFQPAALHNLSDGAERPWLERFTLNEQKTIAERSETLLGRAAGVAPGNTEISRLWQVARATRELVRLASEYHQALVWANLGRNAPETGRRAQCHDLARGHLKQAIEAAWEYRRIMLPLVPLATDGAPRESVNRYRLNRDVQLLYLASPLCVVREAAYLLDEETGGDGLLLFFDTRFGVLPAAPGV